MYQNGGPPLSWLPSSSFIYEAQPFRFQKPPWEKNTKKKTWLFAPKVSQRDTKVHKNTHMLSQLLINFCSNPASTSFSMYLISCFTTLGDWKPSKMPPPQSTHPSASKKKNGKNGKPQVYQPPNHSQLEVESDPSISLYIYIYLEIFLK